MVCYWYKHQLVRTPSNVGLSIQKAPISEHLAWAASAGEQELPDKHLLRGSKGHTLNEKKSTYVQTPTLRNQNEWLTHHLEKHARRSQSRACPNLQRAFNGSPWIWMRMCAVWNSLIKKSSRPSYNQSNVFASQLDALGNKPIYVPNGHLHWVCHCPPWKPSWPNSKKKNLW